MGVYRKIKRLLKVLTNQADTSYSPPYKPCPECRSCMVCELHLDDCSQRLAQQDTRSTKAKKGVQKNATTHYREEG